MICSKTGFTPLKIAALVVGGIAIVIHITAVAYPEWDGVDAIWYPIPGNTMIFKTIKSQGSLWDVTYDDQSGFYFPRIRGQLETSKFVCVEIKHLMNLILITLLLTCYC